MYEWVIIANKDEITYPQWSIGWHYKDSSGYDWGICLFDYALEYNADAETGSTFCAWAKMALLHEFGHHAGILELNTQGYELYCTNEYCCMAGASDDNAIAEPWYCVFHWSLRDSPYL